MNAKNHTKPDRVSTTGVTILTKPESTKGIMKLGDGDACSLSKLSAQSGHHTAVFMAVVAIIMTVRLEVGRRYLYIMPNIDVQFMIT
jgi:hypothetical protein